MNKILVYLRLNSEEGQQVSKREKREQMENGLIKLHKDAGA